MQVAHFKNIRAEIIKSLQSAAKTVDIAMAWFTSTELFQELLTCLRRNVNVRLILLDSPINFMEYAPDFNEFIEAGGKLYIAKSDIGFMHHKFCVIDNASVISGSYNWTYFAENRNVENVIISDHQSIVYSYIAEFDRLLAVIHSTSLIAPRYSTEDIEAYEGIDYSELNEEINYICHAQGRCVKKVFETHTEIIISESKFQPLAKEKIGIVVEEGTKLMTFIEKGEHLPALKEVTLYFDSQSEQECPCKIIREDADIRHLVKEADILQIARGTYEPNLPVVFSMRLDDNGSLRVDVTCEKSGEHLVISALDKNLVKYV